MKSYEVKFKVGEKAKVIDAGIVGRVTIINISSEYHISYKLECFDGTEMKEWWFVGWQLEEISQKTQTGFSG